MVRDDLFDDMKVEGNEMCPLCEDSGFVDDPGPHEGCWDIEAFCRCEAGRNAQMYAENAAFEAQERGHGF